MEKKRNTRLERGPIVKIDETELRNMIIGDEDTGEKPKTTYKEDVKIRDEMPEISNNTNISEETNKKSTSKKSKKNVQDYDSVFLIKRLSKSSKKQRSIIFEDEYLQKVEWFLKFTDGVTLSVFINNLIINHLNDYSDIIEAIKETIIEKVKSEKK